MSTAQFRIEDERTEQTPPAKRNATKSCLIGCLAITVVLVLVGIVASIYIYKNMPKWIAAGGSQIVNQSIDASDLPAEEKGQIKAEADRFFTAVREGRVSNEQLAVITQQFVESPLMTALAASAADTKYLDKSGLSDEEKAEGRVTIQRFLRGSIDNEIDRPAMDAAMSHVADKQGDSWQFRDTVSDEELRAFLAEAKSAADAAQVPEQPQKFDPSDEVKRIIDEALNEPAADAPPLEMPPPSEVPPEPNADK